MFGYCSLLANSRKLWLSAGLRMETLKLGGSGRNPIVYWRYHSGVSLVHQIHNVDNSNLTVNFVTEIGYFCWFSTELMVILIRNFRVGFKLLSAIGENEQT